MIITTTKPPERWTLHDDAQCVTLTGTVAEITAWVAKEYDKANGWEYARDVVEMLEHQEWSAAAVWLSTIGITITPEVAR